MASSPTVRRMVIFKHGVAYIERAGPAEGTFELSFERDEMNEVLKSLAVWVARGEARVDAVAFDKPENPEDALARRRLLLEPGTALHGLLGSLRGRRVAVESGGVRTEGEVVGLDAPPPPPEGPALPQRLLLRTAEGRIALVDLGQMHGFELLESPSRADLEFLIDRNRAATAGERRTVKISLSGRAEELRVAYVVPAPIWRVSYRLATSEGVTVLMAWGIVHNPADEELQDISLTLTTGQPVSFVIDLYHPKEVKRVVVEEKSRALTAPPTAYESMAFGDAVAGAAPRPPRAAMPPPPAPMAAKLIAAAPPEPTAEGVTRGELFEYRVSTPVSLGRGASAMVPLLTAKLDARRERFWRADTGLAPDLVLSFENTTGAVLEEGPAVFYDEDAYAGEAMVPFTARGAGVRLTIAKDLAMRCRRTTASGSVIIAVRPTRESLVIEERFERRHEVTAESDHDEPVELVVELAREAGWSLDPAHATAREETATHRRFALTVPPHAQAKLTVLERRVYARTQAYASLTAAPVQQWFEQRFLDEETFRELSEVLAAQERARTITKQAERARSIQGQAFQKQEKLTRQLEVLKDGGAEGALRLRYVRELEAEQDRINATEAELKKLAEAVAHAEAEAAALLTKLPTG
jgi:hypothetical protein